MSKSADSEYVAGDRKTDAARALPGWDPLVRLTHWGIALAVLLNGIFTEDGSAVHVWVGYAALSFLLLRLLWGFVGTENARFTAFPPNIRAALDHLRRMFSGTVKHDQPSHNPAGALMVYAMWATLAVVSATGVAMAGSPFDVGDRDISRKEAAVLHPRDGGTFFAISPAHADDDGDGDEYRDEGENGEDDELLEGIHEFAANLLLFLAALHVGGVVVDSRLSGRNLAREMVTGRRMNSSHDDD